MGRELPYARRPRTAKSGSSKDEIEDLFTAVAVVREARAYVGNHCHSGLPAPANVTITFPCRILR